MGEQHQLAAFAADDIIFTVTGNQYHFPGTGCQRGLLHTVGACCRNFSLANIDQIKCTDGISIQNRRCRAAVSAEAADGTVQSEGLIIPAGIRDFKDRLGRYAFYRGKSGLVLSCFTVAIQNFRIQIRHRLS